MMHLWITAASGTPEYGRFVLQTLLALGVLAAIGLWIVKTLKPRMAKTQHSGRCHVEARHPLGRGQELLEVVTPRGHYLLGVTEHHVSLIDSWQHEERES